MGHVKNRSQWDIIWYLSASGILKQMLLRQESDSTGKHPPINVFPSGHAGLWGRNNLNLMFSVLAVIPKVVPIRKLIRAPLILAPDRRIKESIQVNWVQRDGLLTAKLPLHAVHMVIPDKHEKYNWNRSSPCLNLAVLSNPNWFYISPGR
ncbi:hypothetical protein PIB30_069276 [Stylosanthes scabra]|uniref:Uncharacterized protein n=1 Tax=Stylosanthes scabra TaxID=79078 RepID=A0ABU6WNT1_9FABA|nr:hypothetical protein [Stylosanthes scabra]